MNPAVLTTFANPDPEAAPLNITQLVALLNTLVMSEIQGSYIPYVIQHETPNVDDRDKAWIYTDTQGRPVEIRIWWENSGAWRRVYNGMLNEVRMYNGDPSVDFNSDGLGNIGGTYDGWHLCNGKDGTPDLSDQFPLGGHMNNAGGHVGYDNGWQSFVDGKTDQKTGGVKDITLNAEDTFQPNGNMAKLTVGMYNVAGVTGDASGPLYGDPSVVGADKRRVLNIESDGNTTPTAIPTVPPFTAIAFIIFVGYST